MSITHARNVGGGAWTARCRVNGRLWRAGGIRQNGEVWRQPKRHWRQQPNSAALGVPERWLYTLNDHSWSISLCQKGDYPSTSHSWSIHSCHKGDYTLQTITAGRSVCVRKVITLTSNDHSWWISSSQKDDYTSDNHSWSISSFQEGGYTLHDHSWSISSCQKGDFTSHDHSWSISSWHRRSKGRRTARIQDQINPSCSQLYIIICLNTEIKNLWTHRLKQTKIIHIIGCLCIINL